MHEGPTIGLQLVENPGKKNELDADYLFHATKADLLLRMGDSHNAEAPYHQAISLSENVRETEFLRIKLEEVSNHRLVH